MCVDTCGRLGHVLYLNPKHPNPKGSTANLELADVIVFFAWHGNTSRLLPYTVNSTFANPKGSKRGLRFRVYGFWDALGFLASYV